MRYLYNYVIESVSRCVVVDSSVLGEIINVHEESV